MLIPNAFAANEMSWSFCSVVERDKSSPNGCQLLLPVVLETSNFAEVVELEKFSVCAFGSCTRVAFRERLKPKSSRNLRVMDFQLIN